MSLPSLSFTTSNNDDDNDVTYSAYCPDTMIPQSTTQEVFYLDYTSTHVSGGAPFINHSSSKAASFHAFTAYKTSTHGVFAVEVILTLRQCLCADLYHTYGSRSSDYETNGALRFRLTGYFYQVTRDICMIGFGSGYSRNCDLIDDIPAVFKVNNVRMNSSVFTSLITATLESLSSVPDSAYFKPISLLMFNEMSYEHSLALNETGNERFHGKFESTDDVVKNLSLLWEAEYSFCLIFSSFRRFELVCPSSSCDSAENCTPFERTAIGYLPRVLSFSSIECEKQDRKFRVLISFSESINYSDEYYYVSFYPKTALIGEGFWDGKKNQLRIVACKILSITGSSKNGHVGDYSVMLTLRFSATRSIRDDSFIRGEIQSIKPTNDSGYFDNILFKASEWQHGGSEGLRYEYTQIDKARKLCTPLKRRNHIKKNDRYSNGLYDTSFELMVKSADGSLFPVYVGDHVYDQQDEFAMNAGDTLK